MGATQIRRARVSAKLLTSRGEGKKSALEGKVEGKSRRETQFRLSRSSAHVGGQEVCMSVAELVRVDK